MIIFPAIDLFAGQAVRLLQGDYANMTIYDSDPMNTAMKFRDSGAEWLHIVDLEGARSGEAANLPTIMKLSACGLKCEVGGGIRDMETAEHYITSGVERVILGTAAVTQEGFVREAVSMFGSEHVAVGADIRDGVVAIRGWQESSGLEVITFCRRMQEDGVKYIICTDISRDGAMKGTNRKLYADLSRTLNMNITASGGVSSLDDVKALAGLGLYGAIIGKAYYTGAIDISQAIEAAKS